MFNYINILSLKFRNTKGKQMCTYQIFNIKLDDYRTYECALSSLLKCHPPTPT